jgi:hypothetical protein
MMSGVVRVCAIVLLAAGLSTVGWAQYSQPVRDVENPARTAVWGHDSGTIDIGWANVMLDMMTVASGQRLVIEHVAVNCTTDADDNISRVTIWINKKAATGMSSYSVPLVVAKQGTTWDGKGSWTVSQSLRLYSDGGGGSTSIDVRRSKTTATATCFAVISGYTLATP